MFLALDTFRREIELAGYRPFPILPALFGNRWRRRWVSFDNTRGLAVRLRPADDFWCAPLIAISPLGALDYLRLLRLRFNEHRRA